MTLRRSVLLVGALLSVFVVVAAGCGGGDDGGSAEPAPAEAPAEEAAGAEVQLVADPEGGLAYDTGALEAAPGSVTVVLTNDSATPHNVAIEDADGSLVVEGEIFSGGGTRDTTAELEAGTYTFFCSVPGHREAGMEGTLTVG